VLKDSAGADTAHIYKDNYTQDELAQLLLDLAAAGIETVIQENGTGATNTAPTGLVLSENWVREGTAAGTGFATLQGIDAEQSGASLIYKIVTADGLADTNGRFEISGDTLLVADPLALDFEQANAHTITIAVTDAAGATSQFDVEIQITDWVGEKVTGKDDKNEVIRGGRGNDSLNGGAGTTRSPGAWARTR
jgi:hypothetical protein